MKDSLWSVDLFRCESATLKSHWVLLIMDQFTRRIVGFAVHAGIVDGTALCRMFNRAIFGQPSPQFLNSDHDPLYRFRRWQANLRIRKITEVKTVPYVPLSHPFIERLIGTIRRECLDRMLFWNERDLENKLTQFADYYNRHRAHSSLNGCTPAALTAPEIRLSKSTTIAGNLIAGAYTKSQSQHKNQFAMDTVRIQLQKCYQTKYDKRQTQARVDDAINSCDRPELAENGVSFQNDDQNECSSRRRNIC